MFLTAQRESARHFSEFWKGKGYEKGQSQPFWLSLLREVFGIAEPEKFITFEDQVHLDNTSFIDGYIDSTHVMIEQKSLGKDLQKPIKQSDGSLLTPYEQAKRYSLELPYSKRPRWIVTSNFESFLIYDMEHPGGAPQMVLLENLDKEYHMLSFLVDQSKDHINKEMEVSIQAGEIVGVLYDKILAQYKDPNNPESQKALNKLCVRLVFCLYAEDAGIFGSKNMFHDYMQQFEAKDFRKALIELFEVLDTKPEDRDEYMDEDLAAFPYVNGGMFAGEIEIPRITDEIRNLILQRASDDFDWSLISPTIFGAVFESTLNPETRRAGGMHYTSIENIHKVIDPLFLDDLKKELADIKAISVAKTKRDRAFAFQNKLAGLKFFDPACGSGNFLTESYTSLRRLENDALRIIYGGDRVIGEMADPIKVSINQFYGIEINDFACSVAQTALWIAESQMMQETDEIVGFNLDPLPLKTYTNIHEGNALRMDWNDVVPAAELNYIMGNPPFIGANNMSSEQKNDAVAIYGKIKLSNSIDYVGAWYHKSCMMMKENNRIKAALVSTNSITQGEQVSPLWQPLFDRFGVHIDFAWRTFQWDSEASLKAHVHCVIIGFSVGAHTTKTIFTNVGVIKANNINPYLLDAPNELIVSRGTPLCDVPKMTHGNMPIDGGNLILSEDEREEFIKKDPQIATLIKRFVGAQDFLNNNVIRYCLWLKGVSPSVYAKNRDIMARLEMVREVRLASSAVPTRKAADTPYQFFSSPQTESPYLCVPEVSSGNRIYIPFGFKNNQTIASNKLMIVPDAGIYHFGVLQSLLHMAWVRVVCGRMKSDYSYSAAVVYNNFPWPTPTEVQKQKIEETAKRILDTREACSDSTLADLYNPLTMPVELLKAHRANDAAVLEAYGFPKDASESEIVARLFKMYQELTKNHN